MWLPSSVSYTPSTSLSGVRTSPLTPSSTLTLAGNAATSEHESQGLIYLPPEWRCKRRGEGGGGGGGGWLDSLSELSHICIQFYTASNKWSKGLGKDLSAHVHMCVCVCTCEMCVRGRELAYCTQLTQEGWVGSGDSYSKANTVTSCI